MKISALIPYKPDNGRRDFLWNFVQKRYERLFPDIELCLGRDDSDLFCRSRAVNAAAQIAGGDLFIIVDTDVIFNADLIGKIMLYTHVHPWIIPFGRGIRLTSESTGRILEQNHPESIQIRNDDIYEVVTIPGAFMNVLTRRCFEAVHGMDERFKGWGREDEALVISLDTICGRHLRMDETIFHLWHEPTQTSPDSLKRNDDLLHRYMNANGKAGEIQRLIEERN